MRRLIAVFLLLTHISVVSAEDTDAFFAPTAAHDTAPLWLWIDSSSAMAASLDEVKTRLLLWLATLPDQMPIGLSYFERSGAQVLLTPQAVGAQRDTLMASIRALTMTGGRAETTTLINALKILPPNSSCMPARVLLISAGELIASDPLIALPKLPIELQVISVDHAERAALWRHLLNVDREHANFQQLFSLNELSSALTHAESAMIARESLSVTSNISVADWPQTLEQSRLFVGLFQPGYRRQWLGNVKRIDVDLQNIRSIATDNEAVYDGGAAEKLRVFPASRQRRVWTYSGDYKVSQSTGWASLPTASSDADLSAPSNELAWTANQNPLRDQRLQQLLQVSNPQQAADVIAWARGVDAFDADSQTRRSVGAVVHSTPLVINYGFDAQRYDAPPLDPDQRYESLLVSTQAGWLHALDASTQTELFSFMPQELLPDLPRLQQQEAREMNTPRYQGLDSSWQAWREETWQTDAQGKRVRDGQIQAQRGDHVLVLGGMRRGGSNYYGLDVTSAQPQWLNSPSQFSVKLQYVIRGGEVAAADNPYHLLGQTWSEPKLAQVRLSDGVHAVWLFGGGYDAQFYDQPIEQLRIENSSTPKQGSALYMIDAKTGALLWWAAQQQADTLHAELRHSVVASPKLLDLDSDGLVDRVYWVDLGGQVFRQDIDNRAQQNLPALAQRIRLQRLAALGGSHSDDRRFFQAPSVAVLRDAAGQDRVVIAVASGNSEQPQETQVQNRVAVLFDDLLLNSSVTTRTFADLQLVDFNVANGITLSARSQGWYWKLGEGAGAEGEKVLASPLILRNQLIVSSVLPQGGGSESLCYASRPLSAQRLYVLNAQTAAASNVLAHFRDLGGSGRFYQYTSNAVMPAKLQLVWAENKPIALLVGADVYRFGQQLLLPDQPLAITKGWRRLQRQVLPVP
jgi:hypothetical protein